jgi:hypothetical protein
MKIKVITSMNQDYHDRIGGDCVRTYLEHWSTDLTVYQEQFVLTPHARIRTVDFDDLGSDYASFQQDPEMNDRCKRFAKKAFCVIHAMTHSTEDWLVWLDADTITLRSDPAKLLHDLLQPRYLAMYLGVRYTTLREIRFGDWLVPETGLFAVNLGHARSAEFGTEYRRRYVERDFADLRRRYDNDVFGAVIESTPADYLDLCAGLKKAYKTPLRHTMFGDYLHHYKAKHSKQHYIESQ